MNVQARRGRPQEHFPRLPVAEILELRTKPWKDLTLHQKLEIERLNRAEKQQLFPLDALLRLEWIDEDMHRAGWRYWYLSATITDKNPQTLSGMLVAIGAIASLDPPSDKELAERKVQYSEATKALKRISRQCFDAVDNVCGYLRAPDWFYKIQSGRCKHQHYRNRDLFNTGLKELVQIFKD